MDIYEQLSDDLRRGERQWREVDQQTAHQLLNSSLPLRQEGDCFLHRARETDTADGTGVYLACLELSQKYWLILATLQEWDARSLRVGVNLPPLELFPRPSQETHRCPSQ